MTPSGPIRIKSGETLHDVWTVADGGPSIEVDPGATGWTIDGFDIGAPRPTDSRPAWRAVGIAIYGGSGGTIRNGRVRDAAAGVYAAAMEGHLVVENMHISGIRWDRPRAVGIQLNQCKGGALLEGVVSDASLVPGGIEDHINYHKCFGTERTPFVTRKCWIRSSATGNGPPTNGDNFTGCGINVGDGGGAWFEVTDNVLVMVGNCGINTGGAHTRITGNLIWGWGAKDTRTGAAVTAHEGATDAYIADNRAYTRAWQWGGQGELGAGFWAHESTQRIVEERNLWQDQTLSGAIWTPPVDHDVVATILMARAGASTAAAHTPAAALAQALSAARLVQVGTPSGVVALYAARIGAGAKMTEAQARAALGWAESAWAALRG